MIGRRLLSLALLALAMPAQAAPESIAVFRDWGAFRDGPPDRPERCYAMAEPPPAIRSGDASASVASWPGRRLRAQLAIHLSHPRREEAPVTLAIGGAQVRLLAKGRQAWAVDRRADAAIVAAMRSGSSMSIASVAPDGTPFADVYRLRGAASAIDAALLACPPR